MYMILVRLELKSCADLYPHQSMHWQLYGDGIESLELATAKVQTLRALHHGLAFIVVQKLSV